MLSDNRVLEYTIVQKALDCYGKRRFHSIEKEKKTEEK